MTFLPDDNLSSKTPLGHLYFLTTSTGSLWTSVTQCTDAACSLFFKGHGSVSIPSYRRLSQSFYRLMLGSCVVYNAKRSLTIITCQLRCAGPAGTGVEDAEVILRKGYSEGSSHAGDVNTCCLCFVADPNNCMMIENLL